MLNEGQPNRNPTQEIEPPTIAKKRPTLTPLPLEGHNKEAKPSQKRKKRRKFKISSVSIKPKLDLTNNSKPFKMSKIDKLKAKIQSKADHHPAREEPQDKHIEEKINTTEDSFIRKIRQKRPKNSFLLDSKLYSETSSRLAPQNHPVGNILDDMTDEEIEGPAEDQEANHKLEDLGKMLHEKTSDETSSIDQKSIEMTIIRAKKYRIEEMDQPSKPIKIQLNKVSMLSRETHPPAFEKQCSLESLVNLRQEEEWDGIDGKGIGINPLMNPIGNLVKRRPFWNGKRHSLDPSALLDRLRKSGIPTCEKKKEHQASLIIPEIEEEGEGAESAHSTLTRESATQFLIETFARVKLDCFCFNIRLSDIIYVPPTNHRFNNPPQSTKKTPEPKSQLQDFLAIQGRGNGSLTASTLSETSTAVSESPYSKICFDHSDSEYTRFLQHTATIQIVFALLSNSLFEKFTSKGDDPGHIGVLMVILVYFGYSALTSTCFEGCKRSEKIDKTLALIFLAILKGVWLLLIVFLAQYLWVDDLFEQQRGFCGADMLSMIFLSKIGTYLSFLILLKSLNLEPKPKPKSPSNNSKTQTELEGDNTQTDGNGVRYDEEARNGNNYEMEGPDEMEQHLGMDEHPVSPIFPPSTSTKGNHLETPVASLAALGLLSQAPTALSSPRSSIQPTPEKKYLVVWKLMLSSFTSSLLFTIVGSIARLSSFSLNDPWDYTRRFGYFVSLLIWPVVSLLQLRDALDLAEGYEEEGEVAGSDGGRSSGSSGSSGSSEVEASRFWRNCFLDVVVVSTPVTRRIMHALIALNSRRRAARELEEDEGFESGHDGGPSDEGCRPEEHRFEFEADSI